jgi:peptidoglycan/xylan/chitin deacetylase (PgdA/CDA1 family)
MVSESEVPYVKHLFRFKTVAQFKSDMDVFLKTYRPITLHDVLDSLKSGRHLAANSFLLTFDDGFREIYDVVAPILFAKGVSGTFFLATAFLDNEDMAHHNKISLLIEHFSRMRTSAAEKQILKILSAHGIEESDIGTALLSIDYCDRGLVDQVADLLDFDFKSFLSAHQPYLTSEQVRKLIDLGFTIGAHSVDHPKYSALSLAEQLRQTRTSVRFLSDRFSLPYGAFSFPHGDSGVSNEFFEEIFAHGDVDVTFGSAGMLREVFPQHLQRFSMENTSSSAERVLAYQYARSICKKMMGRQVIERPARPVQREAIRSMANKTN